MKTIQQVIEDSISLSKRLVAENPGLNNMTFEFQDFPVEDVKEAALAYDTKADYSPPFSRVQFLHLEGPAFIHIRSVEVKAKVVYEVEESLTK